LQLTAKRQHTDADEARRHQHVGERHDQEAGEVGDRQTVVQAAEPVGAHPLVVAHEHVAIADVGQHQAEQGRQRAREQAGQAPQLLGHRVLHRLDAQVQVVLGRHRCAEVRDPQRQHQAERLRPGQPGRKHPAREARLVRQLLLDALVLLDLSGPEQHDQQAPSGRDREQRIDRTFDMRERLTVDLLGRLADLVAAIP
jgi:hypothetical protein